MNFAISYKCPIGLACVTMQMNFIIFFALGKIITLVGRGYHICGNYFYYICGKRLLHLRELLHLWEDIITLVVGYYKFSDYYTCGCNMVCVAIRASI